ALLAAMTFFELARDGLGLALSRPSRPGVAKDRVGLQQLRYLSFLAQCKRVGASLQHVNQLFGQQRDRCTAAVKAGREGLPGTATRLGFFVRSQQPCPVEATARKGRYQRSSLLRNSVSYQSPYDLFVGQGPELHTHAAARDGH